MPVCNLFIHIMEVTEICSIQTIREKSIECLDPIFLSFTYIVLITKFNRLDLHISNIVHLGEMMAHKISFSPLPNVAPMTIESIPHTVYSFAHITYFALFTLYEVY